MLTHTSEKLLDFSFFSLDNCSTPVIKYADSNSATDITRSVKVRWNDRSCINEELGRGIYNHSNYAGPFSMRVESPSQVKFFTAHDCPDKALKASMDFERKYADDGTPIASSNSTACYPVPGIGSIRVMSVEMVRTTNGSASSMPGNGLIFWALAASLAIKSWRW